MRQHNKTDINGEKYDICMATECKLCKNPKFAVVLIIAVVLIMVFYFSTTQKQVTAPAAPEVPEIAAPEAEQAAEAPAPPEEQQPAAAPEAAVGHPQLKIISLVNRPTSPKTGDVVTFTLTVKNTADDAPATTVEFVVNGASIATVPLEALTRNAGAVVKATWTAPGKGNYAVTANVKPVPGEVAIDDNIGKITFTVFS